MTLRALTTADINKRSNAEVLIKRLVDGRFQLCKTAESVAGLGKLKLGGAIFEVGPGDIEAQTKNLGSYASVARPAKIEFFTTEGWVKLSEIHKDQELSGQKKRKAGADGRKDQERQERALVEIINEVALTNPIKIPGVTAKIVKAEKYEGLSSLGNEPYTDIIITDEKGKKYNVSCKDVTAPSLGGGGLAGLRTTVPEFIRAFYDRIKKDLKADGFEEGKSYHFKTVPDYYYEITSESFLKKIFIGNTAMGGPVHYMYIGPMDVTFNGKNFNGTFIPIAQYYKKYKFYLRLRKRDIRGEQIMIDFQKTNKEKLPAIFLSGGGRYVSSRITVDKSTYGNRARQI